jgi:hypothetical protein
LVLGVLSAACSGAASSIPLGSGADDASQPDAAGDVEHARDGGPGVVDDAQADVGPEDAGSERPPWQPPPCYGVDAGAALSCAEENCSTKGPDDPTGQLAGTAQCLSDNCAGPFSYVAVDCVHCLVGQLDGGATFGAALANCNQ